MSRVFSLFSPTWLPRPLPRLFLPIEPLPQPDRQGRSSRDGTKALKVNTTLENLDIGRNKNRENSFWKSEVGRGGVGGRKYSS